MAFGRIGESPIPIFWSQGRLDRSRSALFLVWMLVKLGQIQATALLFFH